jgi:MinD-like ATPase involved in chromosome partitioning or flagellar assembly
VHVSKAASDFPDGSVGRYVQERWGKLSGAADAAHHDADGEAPAEDQPVEEPRPGEARRAADEPGPPDARVPVDARRPADAVRPADGRGPVDGRGPGDGLRPSGAVRASEPQRSSEAPVPVTAPRPADAPRSAGGRGADGPAATEAPRPDPTPQGTWGSAIPDHPDDDLESEIDPVTPGQGLPAVRPGGGSAAPADTAEQDPPAARWGGTRASAADRSRTDRAADRWGADRTAPRADDAAPTAGAGTVSHVRAAPTHAGTDRDAAAARVAAARRAAEAARLASTRRPPASALPEGDTRTSRTFGGTTPDRSSTTTPRPTGSGPAEPARSPDEERVADAARTAADDATARDGGGASRDPVRRGDDPAVDAAVARAVGRRVTDDAGRPSGADGPAADGQRPEPPGGRRAGAGATGPGAAGPAAAGAGPVEDERSVDAAAEAATDAPPGPPTAAQVTVEQAAAAQATAAQRAAAAWSTRSAPQPADRPDADTSGADRTGSGPGGPAEPTREVAQRAAAGTSAAPSGAAPVRRPADTPAPGVPRTEPRRDDTPARGGRRAAGEDMPGGAARRHPLTPPRGAATAGAVTNAPDTAGAATNAPDSAGAVTNAPDAAAAHAPDTAAAVAPPGTAERASAATPPNGVRPAEPADGPAGRRPGPQTPPRPDPQTGGSRVEQSWPPPPPPPSWPRPPREDNPRRPVGWTEPGAVAAQEAQRARTGQQVDLGGGDLSSARLLRPSKRPPQSGWRRAVYVLSGKLINPGESPLDVRRRELTARVNQPLLGCYKIAMLSLKGGVGKTTVTATLGATFASLRGDRVVAVDANPDRGTLSQKIPLETTATVRHLLRDAQRVRRYTDVRAYTSQGTSRLEVLASEQDPAVSEAFSEDDYRRTVNLLEHFYNIVLTDCGTGLMHSAMYGVLGMADQLIIVSSGSIDGARSASATMDWLDAHGHTDLVANAVAVINCVHRSSGGVDLDRVAEHFALRCRAVVRIPFDGHLEEGAEIDLDRLQPQTRLALLELAASVADGFPS